MIVQANVAQPQIIQRPSFLDAWLGRLAQMGQVGGEVYKAMMVHQQMDATAKNLQGDAMKNAMLMRTEEGIPYLRAHGVPEPLIQQYKDTQERMANFQHQYNMGVINSKGLPGLFDKNKPGVQTAPSAPSPGSAAWSAASGSTPAPAPAAATPGRNAPIYDPKRSSPPVAMTPPSYGGSVDRSQQMPQTVQPNPALEQMGGLLSMLQGDPRFSASNPFGGLQG